MAADREAWRVRSRDGPECGDGFVDGAAACGQADIVDRREAVADAQIVEMRFIFVRPAAVIIFWIVEEVEARREQINARGAAIRHEADRVDVMIGGAIRGRGEIDEAELPLVQRLQVGMIPARVLAQRDDGDDLAERQGGEVVR